MDPRAVVQLERVWIDESRAGADELEGAILELLSTVSGEIFYHLGLAGHERLVVESGAGAFQSPERAASSQMQNFGGVE